MSQSNDDAAAGIEWWNGLDRLDRAYWLARASSATPFDAWNAYNAAGRPTVDLDIAANLDAIGCGRD